MSDVDVRAEAIERIAWLLLELDDPYAEHPVGDWRAEYHPRAVPFVDALGDLLPTIVVEDGPIPVYNADDTIAYWLPGYRWYRTESQVIPHEETE